MADAKEDHQTAPEQIENTTHDDVFGEITEDGPNFRNVRNKKEAG